jgi:flagellin
MSATYANRQLGVTNAEVAKSIEKLSSGMRINRAGDDASGLAVSEKMRGQIRGLNQAERNIQNGVSFIQATEGYLQETQDIIHRLRELSVQSANGIYTEEDRGYIQVEVDQLLDEIDRIASHAEFNGMKLLNGNFAKPGAEGPAEGTTEMWFQVGANMDQREQVFVEDMSTAALNLRGDDQNAGLSLSAPDSANKAIGTLDQALQKISAQRADLGAYQNRFEKAAEGVAIAAENIQAAESRIRDVDMASEMVNYTRDQILSQSGIAMLAQANTRTQSVLSLLG